MRLELEPAFILHSRHYGDTSLIIDCFTRSQGRVSLYARGARAKRKSGQQRAMLNPFIPVLVSAQGKGTLKTITGLEADGPACTLRGRALYCGFYLNELLVRLLPEYEQQENLFDYYQACLGQLATCDEAAGDQQLEQLLRSFEWLLVCLMGMGFSLSMEANSQQPVQPDRYYRFESQLGLITSEAGPGVTSGAALLAFEAGDMTNSALRLEIKHFMRRVLKPLLGGRPLSSRELFR